ncbi:hypothetical protein DNHGIG_33430 [Collibacillus ludicampi]|uniref:Uncharacterized protein n=1 Tax=Collibacillus ludicampi TaxID=2771369 RepID=A0AAV4LJ25_9BACL|nr:hypothetical protein DNHGIG_33430 [Collibacillus ludicampi]
MVLHPFFHEFHAQAPVQSFVENRMIMSVVIFRIIDSCRFVKDLPEI